ncbi:MAG: Calx-beta domain-containing protein [Caldilineaceae bacterium]
MSAVSGRTVSVNYATVDVSATASTDYTDIGTLTFAAGETTKQRHRQRELDDAVVEATESHVTLSAPVNATLADASGIATVTTTTAPNSPLPTCRWPKATATPPMLSSPSRSAPLWIS